MKKNMHYMNIISYRNLEHKTRAVMRAMITMTKTPVPTVIHISCSLSEMERSNNESSLGVAGGGVLSVGTVCLDGWGGTVGISVHVHG